MTVGKNEAPEDVREFWRLQNARQAEDRRSRGQYRLATWLDADIAAELHRVQRNRGFTLAQTIAYLVKRAKRP